MEPKAHHVIIGLFTLIAVVAALFFALWLAKSSADREWVYYEIVFDHAVSGLSKGNPVLYSGIEVGDVLELKLGEDNPGHVRVLVRVEQSVPVRENTRAGLVLANITGSMSVQFSGGSTDSPVLEGSREHPTQITAEPSAFNSLLTNGEALLTKAETLLTSANRVLSEENTENLTAILRNAKDASDSLLDNRDKLVALLERMDDASKRAAEAAIKVSTVSDNANALLQNEGKSVLTSMSAAMKTVQQIGARLDQLTRDNEGALDSGLQGMGELAPALRELRNTLRNLNQFTRRLEEDPTGTIWGGPSIKEVSQ
ncbi:phospholipid/cholesterol/gamma-HCH transport system substrate-binding protein [Marinobacter sp. LV10R510-11A]|uniref:MlaD family protein n=1 Tax=Marinobacter sp. LV10R510-11A TaxID=1415568 RepID=UPI000BB6BD92|nr:MlaD family protein [Marinobacter sp. LV10R510-11A]SOB75661.1 phospholipid/cholesterol/gamma-HCH transport system substrate-binding protein [Marinobacter sp. LV10R510-11A]